jgi:hypothetical protein
MFPKLPNQITEPDTSERSTTPLASMYPSFSTLSNLVSPQPSPVSHHSPTPRKEPVSFANTHHPCAIQSPILHIKTVPIMTKPHHASITETSPKWCCFD